MLIELQIILTSWAIVSLAGGGLAKVEEVKHHQGETEKNRPSHLQQADPQQANLAQTVFVDLVNRRKGSLSEELGSGNNILTSHTQIKLDTKQLV